jgi:2-haloacid dehalogenase
MERWATFDCYGTLIDWNRGIRETIGEELLHEYHEVEPQVEAENPALSYREVLIETARRLGVSEPEALADSLPRWPVFPEVTGALERARRGGWKVAILSNTDRDYLEASVAAIGVPFDLTIVASEIGSYKPAHGHWRAFEEAVGHLPDVHVAASHFHDVVPATELGLKTIWINRLGEELEPEPTRELPNLSGLAEALDELAPRPA